MEKAGEVCIEILGQAFLVRSFLFSNRLFEPFIGGVQFHGFSFEDVCDFSLGQRKRIQVIEDVRDLFVGETEND